ncbi:uncharacterized protein LOC113764702 [Coffea eugenioides]|uniref:uncharacterized protein LOC113764702 n=1 Tax=Coffea eugenioides TaxID=49369 RepID=UPI000F60897E|nr:uncharacterized protein LOC113764702 [Coffea eugenioides]XP_027164470.1 uncharacterized protein LOC113764702 [Coffea eugenioides]
MKYAPQLLKLRPKVTEDNRVIIERGKRLVLTDGWCKWMNSIPCSERVELCDVMARNLICVLSPEQKDLLPAKRCINALNVPPQVLWWHHPEEGCLKCNVDASLDQEKDVEKDQLKNIKNEHGVDNQNGSKRDGYVGGLFRNWLGHVKGDLFFVMVPDMTNTLQTELIAIRLGLEQFLQQFLEDFDEKQEYTRLIIECDNFRAVRIANHGPDAVRIANHGPHTDGNVHEHGQMYLIYQDAYDNIVALKKRIGEEMCVEIEIAHCKREENKAAHLVVSKGVEEKKLEAYLKKSAVKFAGLNENEVEYIKHKIKKKAWEKTIGLLARSIAKCIEDEEVQKIYHIAF